MLAKSVAGQQDYPAPMLMNHGVKNGSHFFYRAMAVENGFFAQLCR
ncbi:hypothetical protein [Serratia odorifera]|nr:hypothetical protein [Serratia odorifera]